MRQHICLVLALLLALGVVVSADPQCLNQSGKKVDWFIALKLPGGTDYAYCDSDNCSSLKIQSTNLNDLSTSPLLQTLKQIQTVSSDSYASLFWNDQPPTQTVSSTYAHAKGVIGAGPTNGFLIVHSTPKFPPIEGGKIVLEIPSGQQIYGQHYFCISAATSTIDSIAAAYNIDFPFNYDGNVPSALSAFPYLTRLLKNIRDNENNEKTVNFKTLGGVSMIKYSKSGKWEVPFYENVAAKHLQVPLMTETWGSPQENANCSPATGYSVVSNVLIDFKQNGVSYKWTKDHSKYAISTDTSKPYVCLGDINRQSSQWKRGGGTVCFLNQSVYTNFHNIMVEQQSCSA